MIKKIEKSTIELADKLARLEKSLFETAWDSDVINTKINNGEFVYWVFEQDNQIVGYLAIQKTFFDIHILGCLLYTSPSPRDLSTSRMPSSA